MNRTNTIEQQRSKAKFILYEKVSNECHNFVKR